MRKRAALLVALALLLSATALAFDGAGYPQWDGSTLPSDSLCGEFNSERVTLRFDPSTDYSNLEDGVVQACFFAYDATETHFLELYLLIPQLVAPGDVLRSGDGEESCSICLYETAVGDEDFYYAGDVDARMSGDTSYELYIETAEGSDSSLHIGGRLTADMCRFERNQPTQDRLNVREAHFDFTLPLYAATQGPGEPTPAPDSPYFPAPTFPSLPDGTHLPGSTFPALPEDTAPPDSIFPGLPDTPRSGSGLSFTLPPDYAVI